MADITIPADRAINHGGAEFAAGGRKFAETMKLWGGLGPQDAVLDIGSGPGRMAIGIGEMNGWSNSLIGFDVIKVDIDAATREITSRHPSFVFHHIDAWNVHYNRGGTLQSHEISFPAEGETIDFAFATSVFTHMFRDEVAHYLRETFRTLKPGGRLLSTWFVLDEVVRAACNAETARYRFAHAREDGTWIENPSKPADVVAYAHSAVVDLLSEVGFIDIHFHKGAWSRTIPKGEARHGQDVFVCSKPDLRSVQP